VENAHIQGTSTHKLLYVKRETFYRQIRHVYQFSLAMLASCNDV